MIVANNKKDALRQIKQCETDAKIYINQAKYWMRRHFGLGIIKLDDGTVIECTQYKQFKSCVKIHTYEIDVVWFEEV
jgi:hypothetical protein